MSRCIGLPKGFLLVLRAVLLKTYKEAVRMRFHMVKQMLHSQRNVKNPSSMCITVFLICAKITLLRNSFLCVQCLGMFKLMHVLQCKM